MPVKPLAAVAIVAAALTAQTSFASGDDESWEMWEARQVLEYEWKRDREAKEAAVKSGDKKDVIVLPPVFSYHDIPGNESPLINRTDQTR